MKRRTLLTAGLGLLAAPIVQPDPAPHVATGSYVALAGLTDAASRRKREAQLGRRDRIVSNYYAWTDPLPDRPDVVPDSSTLMVCWSGTDYARILDGSEDGRIEAAARALAAYRRPVLLRWGWEMNGWWFRWGGTRNPGGAGDYVRAWRRMHEIFASADTPNVAWIWCVNWNNNPDRPDNASGLYYPGDAYADWIAVDGFSDSGESPEQLFGDFYREYRGRKPLMIAETGVTRPDQGHPGPDAQADWIDSLSTWIKERPELRALVWFDTNRPTATGGKVDWRIDANPAELAAYRRLIHDPWFSG